MHKLCVPGTDVVYACIDIVNALQRKAKKAFN